MESDVTQSAFFYKLLAWAETRKKQLLGGLVAIVVIGLGIAFLITHQSQQQTDASNALSKMVVRNLPGPPATPEALLAVAGRYPGTDAGQRAALLAASDLYTQGKYDEARAQFQRFLEEHADSPFTGEAALGVAASLDAQGKAEDAINAYRNVENRFQNWGVVPQAKLALARLLQGQGKLQDAKAELQDVLHTYPGQMNAEAARQFEDLLAAHPELMPAPAPATVPPSIVMPTNRAPIVIQTNRAPIVIPTNRAAAPGGPIKLSIPGTNKA